MTKPKHEMQERFAQEYLVDLNATQAAIRAGYSPKTAASQGTRLLRKVNVIEIIDRLKAERAKRTEITADRVLKELAAVGFSDLRRVMDDDGNMMNPDEWDEDTARAVSTVEITTRSIVDEEGEGPAVVERTHKLKAWPKVSALQQIGNHLGMFPSRHEHTGKGGGPIKTQDVTIDPTKLSDKALAELMAAQDAAEDSEATKH